jgi:hypothetical protein
VLRDARPGAFDCLKWQSAVMTGNALCLPQRNLFYASVKEAHAFLIPLLRFIGLELGAKNVTAEPTFASPSLQKNTQPIATPGAS